MRLGLTLSAAAAALAASSFGADAAASVRQPARSSPSGVDPAAAARPSDALAAEQSGLPQSLDLPDALKLFRFNSPAPSFSRPDSSSSSSSSGDGAHDHDELALSSTVLVVTVDGHVHALKRETGQWLWTLHDDMGRPLGGVGDSNHSASTHDSSRLESLVRSSTARKAAQNSAAAGSPSSGTDLLEVDDRREHDEDEDDEAAEVYVIEPHSEGDIYLFTKHRRRAGSHPSSNDGGTLEKLPLSVAQLVALSPFTFPTHSSRMFVGRKETELVGVDLKTGRLVGVFGSADGWCEWDERAPPRRRPAFADDECDEDISSRPEDLLYMARTSACSCPPRLLSVLTLQAAEYHLSIYSKSPYALLQTLTYTTYSSSSLPTSSSFVDDPLAAWQRTPDARYLQPMPDGNLVCFRAGEQGFQWSVTFDAPAISIFDVALPPSSSGAAAAGGERPQPLMFPQPKPLPADGLPPSFKALANLPHTTFVGLAPDGNAFAMSRDHFPLVAFAPAPQHDIAVHPTDDADEAVSRPCRGIECLVGAHRVTSQGILGSDARRTVQAGRGGAASSQPPSTDDETQPRLGIDAAPAAADETTPASTQIQLSPPTSDRNRTPSSSILSSILGRYYDTETTLEGGAAAGTPIKSLAWSAFVGLAILLLFVRRRQRRSAPRAISLQKVEESQVAEPARDLAEDRESTSSVEDVASPPTPPLRDPQRAVHVRFGSHDDKELPPLPAAEMTDEELDKRPAIKPDDGDDDGASDGAEDEAKGEATPRKKSRRRRGKKGKHKQSNSVAALGDVGPTAEAIAPETVAAEDQDVSTSTNLSISETILGASSV